jgi:hypothetical protein
VSGSAARHSLTTACDSRRLSINPPRKLCGFLSRIDYYGWYSYGFGSYFPEGDPVGYQASRLTIAPDGTVYVTGDRYGYNRGMWLTKVSP